MWKTTIETGTIIKHRAVFDFNVVFEKDGVFYDRFEFKNVSDPASIKQLVRSQLQQYQKVDAIDPALLEGEIDLTLPTPVPVEPTAIEIAERIAKELYARRKMELNEAKHELDLGLKTKAEYDVLLAQVKVEIGK